MTAEKDSATDASLLKVNKSWKIGLITSRFNEPVTAALHEGALQRFDQLGVTQDQLTIVKVAGALEIPLMAQWMLEYGVNGGVDGVVALGAVIRGETSHYDVVVNGVQQGVMQVQLRYGKPIALGVLTTENAQQAYARAGGNKGHKGKESVDVLIEMLNLKAQLEI